MSKPVLAVLIVTLVAVSGLIASASSPSQRNHQAEEAAVQSADAQFGFLEEIDVRGLSDERKAALIAGLPVKLGEPISKGQCKRVGEYVRSFDKQLCAAFLRVDGSHSKAAIIIYRAP